MARRRRLSQCASTRRKRRTRWAFARCTYVTAFWSLLSPPRIPSLVAPHPFSFPHRRRFVPFIYRKHANPRDLTLSPWRTKAGLLAAPSFRMRPCGVKSLLLFFFIPDGRLHLCGTCIVLCGERLIRVKMHGTLHTLSGAWERFLYKFICLNLFIILFWFFVIRVCILFLFPVYTLDIYLQR